MERQKMAHSLIFEKLEAGIIILDRHNRIVDINASAISLMQTPKEALVGAPLAIDHPGSAALDTALQLQRPAKIELLINQIPYDVSISLLEDSTGIPNGRLLTLQNITSRKEMELLLQQAEEAAKAANQSKSHFLTNMSHEIRTPLNAVVGMAEMLRQTPLNANQNEMIDVVAQSSEHLMGLINNILDFAKLESGSLVLNERSFDLIDCVESSLESVSQSAKKKQLQLTYQVLEDTPHWLVGDPVRLRQILINLLENGIKFTEEGQVELSVSHSYEAETLILQFVVKDSGIGIAAGEVEHLFSPFRQVDGSMTRLFGGNGLGLVICKRLVELMGGSIALTSNIGQGTAVRFTARFDVAADSHPPTLTLRSHKTTLTHKRLLLVAKDAEERRHISKEARMVGLEVYPTASVQEASYWIRNSKPFDIALLDAAVWQENQSVMFHLRHKETMSPLPTILLVAPEQQALLAQNPRIAQFAGTLTLPVTGSLLYDMLLNVLALGEATPASTDQPVTMAERYPLDILIVEDNNLNRRILKNLLNKFGYLADVAVNGQIAVQMAAEKSYDVVLMDIQMPVMDGVEATRQILTDSSQGKRPYIVAVTAHAMEGDREFYLSSGMNEYISKPVTANRLVEALYQAIPYHDPTVMDPPLVQAVAPPRPAPSPESPEAASGAPIDFVELATLVGGSIDEFLQLMTPIFLEDTRRILHELTTAVAQQDVKKISQAAHTLKGSSASMAMKRLARYCQELERMAKEQAFASASEKVAEIQAEFDRVVAALNEIVEIAP